MSRPILSDADHRRVTEAVALAESGTSGEIVTVLTDRSDGYTDVALAWATLMAFLALSALALAPASALSAYETLRGGWVHEWSHREILALATAVAALVFGGAMLLQSITALRFLLVPAPIKTRRVHERALGVFRVGAEQRTRGRTGVLIYLSMREHRAEVLADGSIAGKVDAEVWADALEAMLSHVREGDIAGGMAKAVAQVGTVLAQHFPPEAGDTNELPDRLIEV